MFLEEPATIIIRFDEENVLGTIYIDINQFWGWVRCTWFALNFLFIIHKNGNITRA